MPRVLLVDDDSDVRLMTRVNLSFEGFTVTEAVDGFEAVDKALADPPDIVVLDIMMPGRDGLEVLQLLREDERTRNVPIVLLTARAGRDAETEGWDSGATAYLTKPFTAAGLAGTLRRLLDQDADERAGAADTARARIDLAKHLDSATG